MENIHLKKSDFVHIETDLDLYKQSNIYYDKKELYLIWNFFVVIVMESQIYDKNVNIGIF